MKITELMVRAGKSHSASVRKLYDVLCTIKRINDLSKDILFPILRTRYFGILRKLRAIAAASGANERVLFELLPLKLNSSEIDAKEAIKVIVILNKINMEELLQLTIASLERAGNTWVLKGEKESACWLFHVMEGLLNRIIQKTQTEEVTDGDTAQSK